MRPENSYEPTAVPHPAKPQHVSLHRSSVQHLSGWLVFKCFALEAPNTAELVHLTHLAAEDEDQSRVVHPEHHDHERVDRAGIQRAWVELRYVHREDVLRHLEHPTREDRGE